MFKVGQLVKIDEGDWQARGIGTVVEKTGEDELLVFFTGWNGGHNGNGVGHISILNCDSCWWFNPIYLKLERKRVKTEVCDLCGKENKVLIDKSFASEISEGRRIGTKTLKNICFKCAKHYRRCDECRNLYDNRKIGFEWVVGADQRRYLCDHCRDILEVGRCATCGRFVVGGYLEEINEDLYCRNCANRMKGEVDDIWDLQRGKDGYTKVPSTGFAKLPRRNYGLEIEALSNGARVQKEKIRPWLRYSDGSLTTGGEEFASPIFSGDAGLQDVKRLLKVLKENDYTVNWSCAVHCHVEATDYKFSDIKRFLNFMLDYEPVIYSFLRKPCRGGRERLEGVLRRSSLSHIRSWEELIDELYEGNSPDTESKWGDIRYRGLNVHSYFFRKTFEFRYLGPTLFESEICNFARFAVFAVENGKTYHSDGRPVKPTLEKMLKILHIPKDLAEYISVKQEFYKKKREKEVKQHVSGSPRPYDCGDPDCSVCHPERNEERVEEDEGSPDEEWSDIL